MLSVLKICNCKFLGEEFCVSSVMNLAYETIFATFTGKGKLEHGTSDKQLDFLSTLIRGEEGEVPLIINTLIKKLFKMHHLCCCDTMIASKEHVDTGVI